MYIYLIHCNLDLINIDHPQCFRISPNCCLFNVLYNSSQHHLLRLPSSVGFGTEPVPVMNGNLITCAYCVGKRWASASLLI